MLSVIWFACAGIGGSALLVALILRVQRRLNLLVAAFAFGVCGILGAASIGVVFMLIAAGCLVASNRIARQQALPESTP